MITAGYSLASLLQLQPKKGKRLGYGPSFGLFNAAGEYAQLSGDKAFQQRVIETARVGLSSRRKASFLYLFAMAHRFGGGREFLDAIKKEMPRIRKGLQRSLAELPAGRWPGSGRRRLHQRRRGHSGHRA